jgi:hypothetical protein
VEKIGRFKVESGKKKEEKHMKTESKADTIMRKMDENNFNAMREMRKRKLLEARSDIAHLFASANRTQLPATPTSASDSKADAIMRDINQYQDFENKALKREVE